MIQPSSSSINRFEEEDGIIESKPCDPLRESSQSSDESSFTLPAVSRFRCTLPQVLATAAQSLLLLSLGMIMSAPTVVIAALLNTKTESYSMNSTQASWFAGILMVCQPVGSLLSGFLQEWLGRKKCMLLVNVPELLGWYLIYSSQNFATLYIAAILMGLTVGFMEAPTLSYVGEISQPHLRGTLASFTSIYISLGFFLMYVLGTVTKWRTACLISCSAPITTFVAILMIPESPTWLINKNRLQEAEQALCWLRGWVSPQTVRKELEDMIQYCETSKLRATYPVINNDEFISAVSNNEIRSHQSKIIIFLKDITRFEMMKPLRLVVPYFFFYHCASLSGFRAYMVMVFQRLNLPVGPHIMTVIGAVLQLSGGLCCMFLVHRTGKRALSLISMSCCTIICLCLGLYSYQLQYAYIVQPWLPFVLFCFHFFCTNLGISPIPWSLLSEIFPQRGRGFGGGISAAMYYVQFFLVTKTFLDFEALFHLHGVFFFYGILGFIGILFLYFSLPETEGKKLEDVEKIFSKEIP